MAMAQRDPSQATRLSIGFGKAAIAAGVIFTIAIPPQASSVERFLAVQIPLLFLSGAGALFLPLPALAFGIWAVTARPRDTEAWKGVALGAVNYIAFALFVVLRS